MQKPIEDIFVGIFHPFISMKKERILKQEIVVERNCNNKMQTIWLI